MGRPEENGFCAGRSIAEELEFFLFKFYKMTNPALINQSRPITWTCLAKISMKKMPVHLHIFDTTKIKKYHAELENFDEI